VPKRKRLEFSGESVDVGFRDGYTVFELGSFAPVELAADGAKRATTPVVAV
jgi:hypothetical protein